MTRYIYVNGQYQRNDNALVHVEDRGLNFADGVYEVCEIWRGQLVDEPLHLARLGRSLNELQIEWPVPIEAVQIIARQLIHRNKVRDGMLYIQITRGVARRDHAFPDPEVHPTLIMFARSTDRNKAETAARAGVNVISVPENRWPRVDIKSTALLPNILARQQAKNAGAREAWFVDANGFVTEGSYSNAWIITQNNELKTRPAESGILRGITRGVLIEMATQLQLKVVEEPFTIAEAQAAKEAFISAATTLVMPVVRIDDVMIGDGVPGKIATQLRARIHEFTALTSSKSI